jgi:hypothetical protein
MRHQPPIHQNVVTGTQSPFDAWQPTQGIFPSACACGDSCRCPGCSQHSRAPIPQGSAYSSCTNPTSCSFCLDCTILSLPPSTSPPSIDPASDSQNREFEEWLRQVSAAPATGPVNPMGMQIAFSPYELSMNQMDTFSNPSHPRSPQPPSAVESRSHGRCNCSSGRCSCPADSCGCGQRCECDQRCSGSRSRTTFAVSGERGSSSDKLELPSSARMSRQNTSTRLPDYMTMTTMRDGLTASMNRQSPGVYQDQANYLSVTEAPSRSSSSSSMSSRVSGRSPVNAVCSLPLLNPSTHQ